MLRQNVYSDSPLPVGKANSHCSIFPDGGFTIVNNKAVNVMDDALIGQYINPVAVTEYALGP